MRYLNPAAFLMLMVSSSMPLLSQVATAAPEDTEANNNTPSSEEQPQASETSAPAASTEVIRRLDLASMLDSARRDDSQGGAVEGASALRAQGVSGRETLLNRVLSRDEGTMMSPMVANSRSPRFAQSTQSEQSAVDIPVEVAQEPSSQRLTIEELRTQEAMPPDEAAEETGAENPEADLPMLEESTPTAPTAPAAPAAPAAPTQAPSEGAPDEAPSEDMPGGPAAEINELPDILFADPNPLNIPALPEEVDIEKNPVITLEQAVELAYRNNQALQGSLLTLEQSDAAVREATAARLPTVTTQAALTTSADEGTTTTGINGDVTLNYNLLNGGARAANIQTAKLQREVSTLAVEAQQEEIRLQTATVYYALQESGEQIRIQQSFVDEAERNLRDSRLRQEVGVGTRFDVLRAEVQYANARQSVIQAQSNQRIARRDIARFLNLPPTAGVEATPVAVAEDWPLTLEDSIILALDNRAELEQQLLQVDISEQQRRLALAALRPNVGLFAAYNYSDTLSGQSQTSLSNDFRDSATFGAQFNMTLFDGGAARAQARQREIDGQIAEEQFSENADQFRFDVEQAFFNLESNKENIATSQVAVAQAQEALELADLRLQAGVGTQLDVLTAQRELTEAESNNITAILNYNRALAAMQRAVSNLGLFEPES